MPENYRYRLGKQEKRRRGRKLILLGILLLIILLIIWGVSAARAALKPQTKVTQSKAVTTSTAYETKTKHYVETDFMIDIPTTWRQVPRPPGMYQSFTWATSDSGTDGQEIEIYEDTIPTNFAVNHALIVEGQTDHLDINGSASENCTTFTSGLSGAPNQFGTPAKWQDVSFLCDRTTTTRNVVGTSSTEGVNIVHLRNQSNGTTHAFFFTYTTHSVNPDYSAFYNALHSFRMQ